MGYITLHIKERTKGLPEAIRRELTRARRDRRWSQAELAKQAGLTQEHVSGIETGKLIPRFDTLLDLVRALDRDFVLTPQPLVPIVQAMIYNHLKPEGDEEDQPLYVLDQPEEEVS